jgi:hypothetical protein
MTTAQAFKKDLVTVGIKARCREYESCGSKFVQVFVTSYEQEFTEGEQGVIKLMAIDHGFTLAGGLPIMPDQMTNPKRFDFEVSK